MAKAKNWKKSKGDGHLTTISGIYPANGYGHGLAINPAKGDDPF